MNLFEGFRVFVSRVREKNEQKKKWKMWIVDEESGNEFLVSEETMWERIVFIFLIWVKANYNNVKELKYYLEKILASE
jgi:hypothetical protein